jgi:hypothetical protein
MTPLSHMSNEIKIEVNMPDKKGKKKKPHDCNMKTPRNNPFLNSDTQFYALQKLLLKAMAFFFEMPFYGGHDKSNEWDAALTSKSGIMGKDSWTTFFVNSSRSPFMIIE